MSIMKTQDGPTAGTDLSCVSDLQEDFEFDGQARFQDPGSTSESTTPMEGENMGGWWPEHTPPDTGVTPWRRRPPACTLSSARSCRKFTHQPCRRACSCRLDANLTCVPAGLPHKLRTPAGLAPRLSDEQGADAHPSLMPFSVSCGHVHAGCMCVLV